MNKGDLVKEVAKVVNTKKEALAAVKGTQVCTGECLKGCCEIVIKAVIRKAGLEMALAFL